MAMYDSDVSLSTGPEDIQVPEYDIDVDKQHLIAQNTELLKENAQLKAQFEEVCKVATQFQDLHVEHSKLHNELRDEKRRNEDMSHRLDICAQKNRELARQLEQEKKMKAQQSETNTTMMNSEIEKIRQESKEQVDALYDEIDQLKTEYEKTVLQRKVMDGKLAKLMQAAELHFGTKLGNLDAVIASLETLDKPQARSETSAPKENNDNELALLKKKLKKRKSKCSALIKERGEMESTIQKSQTALQQATMDHKRQLMDFETKLAEISDEQELKETQHKSQVLQLEGQIRELKNELTRIRDIPPPPTPQPVKIVVKEIDETKVKELEQERNDLISKRDAVYQQLQVAQSKKEEVMNALKACEDKYTDLKIAYEKLNNEATGLKSVKDAMEKENERLRQDLHTASAVKEEEKPKKVETMETARIKRYQHEIDAKQKQIVDLTAETAQQRREIESHVCKIRAIESAKEGVEAELKKTKEMLNEQRAKADMKKKCVAPEEILSVNDFICPSFDGPLASTIQKVASNQSLSPASKVQGCFSAIANHFGEKMSELAEAFEESLKETQKMNNICNKFVVDMSIAVTDEPHTFEEVQNTSIGQELIERVNDLRMSADAMKRERDQMKGVLSHLSETFERGDADPVTTINELKEVLMTQQAHLSKKSKQLKVTRAEATKLAKLIKAREEENTAIINDLKGEVENVSSQLAATTKALNAVKAENQNLLTDIANLNDETERLQKRIIEVKDNTTKRLTDDANARINALNEEIDRFKEQVKQLVDDANHDRNEITKLKNTNQSLTHQLKDVTDENNALKKKAVDDEQRFNHQNEAEKSGIKEAYENTIAELQKQCEKHRSDVQRFIEAKKEVEEKLMSTRTENARLLKECKALNGDIDNLQAQAARQKKLFETSATAKRIEYECNFNMKLDELRSKFEYDKKQMCSFCAETLNMFFDPNEEISERSTRRVIEMAKEEITRLTAADQAIRRLVEAREGQETEDAVARIVLKM